jgi:hypothetical protein
VKASFLRQTRTSQPCNIGRTHEASPKNPAHVVSVLRWILRIYADIVEVVKNEVVHIQSQVIAHVSLECRRCISQPEWHDPIFELTISGLESRCELIAVFDSDKVIRAAYISINNSMPGNRRITSSSHLYNNRLSTPSVRPEID